MWGLDLRAKNKTLVLVMENASNSEASACGFFVFFLSQQNEHLEVNIIDTLFFCNDKARWII